jgi:hypothetical protein
MNATGAVRHFLLFLLGLGCSPAFADDLQRARNAVNSFLVKDGGGLVSSKALCPPSVGNLQEYVTRIEFVPVSATTNALLLSSEMCGGGNKHGQYLYISKSSGGGDLITDAEIGDMSFIGRLSHVEGDTVYLYGNRWTANDAHCCPSKEGTLSYNVATRKHAFDVKDVPK